MLGETVLSKNTAGAGAAPDALPGEPNRFFGREDDAEQMTALLTENRLVTLLGPGGVGKTRLSLATARRHALLFRRSRSFPPAESGPR